MREVWSDGGRCEEREVGLRRREGALIGYGNGDEGCVAMLHLLGR